MRFVGQPARFGFALVGCAWNKEKKSENARHPDE